MLGVDISAIDLAKSSEGNENFDASFMNPNFTKFSLGTLGGVLMKKNSAEEIHFEVPCNKDAKLYDHAVDLIKDFCKDVDLSKIHSLKFHTNTWGLSACNAFADDFIPKMKSLKKIDMSDTVKFRYRSDCPNGCKAILYAARNFKIEYLDLSHNQFEDNGAKSFAEFMEHSKTLKVLKVHNCGLGKVSAEMILQAIKKNPNLQLTHLDFGKNPIDDEGMELMA